MVQVNCFRLPALRLQLCFSMKNSETYCHLVVPQLLYKLTSGFDRDSVELLVNYAYTGHLEVPEPLIKAVFIAAKRLKVCLAENRSNFE